MLYYLSKLLSDYDLPGSRLLEYVTFRSGAAFVLSMLIAIFIGRRIINRLQLMQVGEIVRNLGLDGQMKKTGTPTMGGIIIIIAIVVPCLLVAKLANPYMLLMLFATLWLGTIGFLDDYKKVKKHNKEGMKGKYKIVGQIGIGVVVAATMYLNPEMVEVRPSDGESATQTETTVAAESSDVPAAPVTTIPFVKNHNFDYSSITGWMGIDRNTGGWVVFLLITIFFVAATSNGANLTDGLDGLCAGTSAIIGVALAIMAYLGGNVIYSGYLNIMYIPGSEELAVYAGAFIGALVGFLWYNAFPAQVFMGDTGSLTLGGVLAVFAILIRKELLIPLLCLIFFIEDLSVVLQVGYFKYTRLHKGGGRRIFKMTPLHHHFQKAGDASIQSVLNYPHNPIPESKIVVRFWIVGILLAALTFVTLKIR